MKRIFVSLVCFFIFFSLTACGAGNVGDKAYMDAKSAEKADSAVETTDSQPPLQETLQKTEGIDNIMEYFIADSLISESSKKTVTPEIIGAKKGVRYEAVTDSISFNLEFYEFDKDSLNATAVKTIESVKNNGYFTVLDTNVSAVISDNGKYLMILDDNNIPIEIRTSIESIFSSWP